jgi:hypothetical protein
MNKGILERLRRSLDDARKRRDAAAERFDEALREVPSGLPHPDGQDRVRFASRDYSAARAEVSQALKRLTDYMVNGQVPTDLDVKEKNSESGM